MSQEYAELNQDNIDKNLLENIKLRYRLRELCAFFDYAIELGKCEEIDELIEVTIQTIKTSMDFDSITIFTFDEDQRFLELHPSHVSPLKLPYKIFLEEEKNTQFKKVMAKNEPFTLSSSEVPNKELSRKMRAEFLSILPLQNDQKPHGVMVVGRNREITEEEVRTLFAFSDQLVRAMRSRNLVDELRQRIEELSSVYELSQAVNSVLELDALLDIIVNMAAEILRTERCSLMLLDDNHQEMHIVAAKGVKPELVENVRVKIGEGIAGMVAQTGEPLLIKDIEKEVNYRKVSLEKYSTKSLLTVPLKIRNKVIGVLNINNKLNKQVFSKADMRLLTTFANSAAMAIENARLTEEKVNSERLATVGRMASSIMHDIRNPMTVIKGYAEMIGSNTPKYKAITQTIVREVDTLVNMTRELLDFSKGVISLHLETVEIGKFIDEIFESLSLSYYKKSKTINLESVLDYDGLIRIDPEKMKRVFLNIGNNAMEAMSKKGTLKIICNENDEFIEFKISDTGKGIEKDKLEKIFEPFVSYKDQGTGLGLAIAKQIVENHGGKIDVTSKLGEGTTFIIQLPRRSVD
jgi:K+-sensing histidine kinase KdpD